uniref:Uncharacterized protein LOC114344328 n=1 Tax=Diabrotica virgifera virgifera TaxID=50390 RepID=A0A6P7GZS4_DIAVI
MLYFNIKKCFKITFGRSREFVHYDYCINNVPLEARHNIKDLGINFDSKLTFKYHINETSAKALKMLGFILRNCNQFSVQTLKMLYFSLVRSVLEYGSLIWSPSYNSDIYSIERVQNKFLRVCAYKIGFIRQQYTYDDILSILNISPLHHRRCQADLCFLFKIINGYVQDPEL